LHFRQYFAIGKSVMRIEGDRGMAAQEALAALVGEFAQRTGMGELPLDGNGIAALAVDGRFVLHMATDDAQGDLVLYAPLGRVRDDERLGVWRRLLEFNPSAPGGTSLGLDPGSGEVLLVCRRSLAALDYATFERGIESFIATAGAWAQELAAGAAAEPAAPAADDPASRFLWHGLRA
jgi:hypothetical protein